MGKGGIYIVYTSVTSGLSICRLTNYKMAADGREPQEFKDSLGQHDRRVPH